MSPAAPFPLMRLNDRLIGVLAILAGLAVMSGTFGFREIPGQQFGSAFFPRILAVAMILAGLAQIWAGIQAGGRGAWLALSDVLHGRGAIQSLCVVLAVIGWVVIAPLLGFIATTALMIAALSVVAGARAIRALAVGIAMSCLLFVIFAVVLRVPLPRGPIEGLLT